jgi:alkylhydroperoxidase family enzyme
LAQHQLTEAHYANVANWETWDGFTDADRVGIEFAEKFALRHQQLDDAFFARMKQHYTDAEIFEISVAVGTWMAMGRITMIMDVHVSCPLVLPLEEPAAVS